MNKTTAETNGTLKAIVMMPVAILFGFIGSAIVMIPLQTIGIHFGFFGLVMVMALSIVSHRKMMAIGSTYKGNKNESI